MSIPSYYKNSFNVILWQEPAHIEHFKLGEIDPDTASFNNDKYLKNYLDNSAKMLKSVLDTIEESMLSCDSVLYSILHSYTKLYVSLDQKKESSVHFIYKIREMLNEMSNGNYIYISRDMLTKVINNTPYEYELHKYLNIETYNMPATRGVLGPKLLIPKEIMIKMHSSMEHNMRESLKKLQWALHLALQSKNIIEMHKDNYHRLPTVTNKNIEKNQPTNFDNPKYTKKEENLFTEFASDYASVYAPMINSLNKKVLEIKKDPGYNLFAKISFIIKDIQERLTVHINKDANAHSQINMAEMTKIILVIKYLRKEICDINDLKKQKNNVENKNAQKSLDQMIDECLQGGVFNFLGQIDYLRNEEKTNQDIILITKDQLSYIKEQLMNTFYNHPLTRISIQLRQELIHLQTLVDQMKIFQEGCYTMSYDHLAQYLHFNLLSKDKDNEVDTFFNIEQEENLCMMSWIRNMMDAKEDNTYLKIKSSIENLYRNYIARR